MERIWNTGGKNWTYEYKYRRGGKTLCSLYAKWNCIGFMIIFGKDERTKFDDIRGTLSKSVCKRYDEATTYHDGKWVIDVYKRQVYGEACTGIKACHRKLFHLPPNSHTGEKIFRV